MEKIKTWLEAEEKNLEDGIRLFGEYSRNRSMYARMWTMLRNPSKLKDFLIYQLERLYSLHTAHSVKQKPVAVPALDQSDVDAGEKEMKAREAVPEIPASTKPIQVTDDDFSVLSDEMKDRYKEVQEIYPKLGILHEEMKACEDDETRKRLLDELARIDAFCADFWNDLDAARKAAAEKPEENPAPVAEPTENDLMEKAADLKKSIRNKKTTIARVEREIPELTGTKKINKQKDLTRHKEELAAFEAELEAIEGRL